MSKYQDVANYIEGDIIKKKYHCRLPEQVNLAQKYKTSRVTIVHALKILKRKKLIKTVKGHGTYVVSKPIPNFFLNSGVSENIGFTKHYKKAGKLKSNVITFKLRKANDEECKVLNLNNDDQVYDIIRQRILNNQPTKLEYTIMPVKVIPGINLSVLHKSVYSYIENTLDLKIGKNDRIISAEKADAYDMKYLDCTKDDPVLCVQQKAYLQDGRVFEFSRARNRYDRGAMYSSSN